MYEQIADNYKRMMEAGMQAQQDFFRQWSSLWSGPAASQSAWMQHRNKFAKECCQVATDLLNTHRTLLDNNYQAGIKSFEDAFRVAEAKDPVEFRQRAEEFYRRSFDVLKGAIESSIQQTQTAMEKCTALATKAIPG